MLRRGACDSDRDIQFALGKEINTHIESHYLRLLIDYSAAHSSKYIHVMSTGTGRVPKPPAAKV